MTRHKGYTLTEILIVVSIIVILGIILLVGINPMQQLFKGYDSRRRADLNKIKIALEAYYADHECYPKFPLEDSMKRPTYECNSNFLKPYLNEMPCDPNTKQPYLIYYTPQGDVCPQGFAVYAQIYSFFDKNADKILDCPKTLAVTSAGISYTEINYGCSMKLICYKWYGCRNGNCVVIAENSAPSCSPSFCDADCSPVDRGDGTFLNCASKNSYTGEYIRECK